jgi:hypothetical protein
MGTERPARRSSFMSLVIALLVLDCGLLYCLMVGHEKERAKRIVEDFRKNDSRRR